MSTLSIGKAWEEAKTALVANRKLLVPVALSLILLPAVIVSMIEPQAAAGEQAPAGPWMILALLMVAIMVIGELAIVLLINGWRGSVGGAISTAGRRMPIFILAALSFLVPMILVLSAVLAFAGAGPGSGGEIDWTDFTGGDWLMLSLAMLAVIYVSIRLLPILAVVACERLGPIGSLKRSFALSSGHFWRLFAFLFLLSIAFLVIAAVVGAVIGGGVTLALGEPEPWTLSLLLIALVGGLIQAGFVLVYTAMLARIYAQLALPRASVPDVSRDEE